MNKGDLVNKLAESTDLSKAQATDALNVVLNSIGEALKDGDKVALVGFGTFSTGHRAERQGRNPRTGEAITIKAKTTVKFKAGKELADAVN
ncbi:MAG: HU family DNA-binding protein [Saprospiraceae bacterium]